MHVRVRLYGRPEVIVSVPSKLTKIDQFRKLVQDKFGVKPNLQRLFYGGKLLENGYTFYDYNIKLNDVIQLMVHTQTSPEKENTKNFASENKRKDIEEPVLEYKDAESLLYTVGDFIDMRDTQHGAWFEARIVRIVHDPATHHPDINSDQEDRPNKENDPVVKKQQINADKPKSGIEKFFCKTPKQPQCSQRNGKDKTEDLLLYKVHISGGDDIYCKLKDIRPRARNVVNVKDLKIGQLIMLNHNPEYPFEIGYWYDFKVCEIVSIRRNSYELIGTIYLGPDVIPQNDTRVTLRDKMFEIEEVIPLEDRTEEYKELMKTQPDKRLAPLNCRNCRDDENKPCKECGCYLCAGKDFPEKILLCDDCNKGYHMECLEPPLTDIPEGDWYCDTCKIDPNEVVAPGAAKQKKREITTNRDWGRGMACVGKTKSCSMPANHFGPIPGIEVGMLWRFRIQLSESGVHRPPVSGIHGRDMEGAYSIVLSGGYEDDVDHGNEFTYTGSGGRDLSGNKRTAGQSCDQKLTRENRALARNCAVRQVNEEGDDAGDNWREGRPVRVLRSYKMLKHFPMYAPKEGNRYDGIYKVVKYYPEKGKSGFRVWKYLLRRDDPSPAPWELGAKHFDIVYPDCYIEAEQEKKAQKELAKSLKSKSRLPIKRALQETLPSMEEQIPSEFAKKRKGPEGDEGCGPPTSEGKGPEGDEGCGLSTSEGKGPEGDEGSGPSTLKRKGPGGDEGCGPSTSKRKGPGGEGCGPSTAKSKLRRPKKESVLKSPKTPPKVSIIDMLKTTPKNIKNSEAKPEESKDREKSILSDEEKAAISMDTMNAKLWGQCLDVCAKKGKKEFVERVSDVFLCGICQELLANPVTTPCIHNFCMGCLKQVFKASGTHLCPYCRRNLTKVLKPNDRLKAALRVILPGYDANRT